MILLQISDNRAGLEVKANVSEPSTDAGALVVMNGILMLHQGVDCVQQQEINT